MTPGIFGSLYGGENSSYHWTHHITPQQNLNNRSLAIMSGKGLGGGSAINFMFWTHASRRDVDNWGALNSGQHIWLWERFQFYLKKAEAFVKPTAQQVDDLNLTFIDPSAHGYNGPVVNSFPGITGPFLEAWPRTFRELGLGINGDPRGGTALGGYTPTFNVNPETKERSYPGSVYTALASKRPNLRVLTGALVTKVLLKKIRGNPAAFGVSYEQGGRQHQVRAKREVILSAGALASPKLLELSGIGDEKLLSRLGIRTMVDSPFVGENYQNHVMVPLGFNVKPNITTAEDFNDPASFEAAMTETVANRTGPFTAVNASSSLLSLSQLQSDGASAIPADSLHSASPGSHPYPGITVQHDLIAKSLSSNTAAAQIISLAGGLSPWFYNDTARMFASPNDGGRYFSLLALLQQPFSRGSVHIQSADARIPPIINSGDLSHPLDLEITKQMVLKAVDIVSSPPLSGLLQQETPGERVTMQPGYPKEGITEANVQDFIQKYALVAAHYSGTCAMMDKKLGGVVDSRLRVYGVSRLRVVDASVFPVVPQGTINSAVIGIAELAADLVKEYYQKL
ncbi:oxygen-dependent choline dehydrogenase [Rhypophila decipiens]